MSQAKRVLAETLDKTGLARAALRLQRPLYGPYIRALNYHDVPPELAPAFEAQLAFYAEHFVFVGMEDLLALQRGEWPHPRPGLLLTFDDGLRSHAEVTAPLLEAHGATGWFMVPAAVVQGAPGGETHAHTVQQEPIDFEGLRRLDERHEIGCHTFSHRRLEAGLSDDELEWEIVESKRRLEAWLGHPVETFAWVGGEEWTYSAAAAERIRAAGFRVSFMTNNAVIRPGADLLQLQRTNIEAHFDPVLVRFGLTGFLDLMYAPKRRRVNRLTAAPPA